MADYSPDGYHAAMDAFLASPSESTKAAVVAIRAGLPDLVVSEGVTTQLPNGSTLVAMLDSIIAGKRASASRRRIIKVGLKHNGAR
jgi:hypothetical protein